MHDQRHDAESRPISDAEQSGGPVSRREFGGHNLFDHWLPRRFGQLGRWKPAGGREQRSWAELAIVVERLEDDRRAIFARDVLCLDTQFGGDELGGGDRRLQVALDNAGQ